MDAADTAMLAELNFFLGHLFLQVAHEAPADPIAYAANYFATTLSQSHVLGAQYTFITSCNHNRRSFVFCLMELFRTFPLNEELTAVEYQQIIEMICPDFPRQVVLEASYSVKATNTAEGSSSSSPKMALKYRHEDLRVALYFHIIYEEWLKRVEMHFREEGSLEYLNIFRVRTHLDEIRSSPKCLFEHPPQNGIEEIITLLSNAPGTVSGCDVTFDGFKKTIFSNKLIAADVLTTSKDAAPLLSSPVLEAVRVDELSVISAITKQALPPQTAPPPKAADEASDDDEND